MKKIIVDEVYYFTKSMNKVKTIEQLENNQWRVERTDTKKLMIVNSKSLLKEEELEENNFFIH